MGRNVESIDNIGTSQIAEQKAKDATKTSETFFKTSDGSFKWINIGGTLAAAVAIGFGIKFLVNKFIK